MAVYLISKRPEMVSALQVPLTMHYKLELTVAKDEANAKELLQKRTNLDVLILDTDAVLPGSVERVVDAIAASAGKSTLFAILVGMNPEVERLMNKRSECFGVDWPLDLEHFHQVVNLVLGQINPSWTVKTIEELSKDNSDCYVPVKIKNLYRFRSLPYDAYLNLGSDHFVKLAQKDDIFGPGMLQRYIGRGVHLIYIRKDQHANYLSKVLEECLLFNGKRSELLPHHKKCFSLIHEFVRTLGVGPDIVKLTKKVLESIFESYQHQGELTHFLLNFPMEFADPAEISLLSCYANMHLADELEFSSRLSKFKLGLSAILQDCLLPLDGIAKIDNTFEEDYLKLSDADKELYCSHPVMASEVATLFNGFSEVEFILQAHHERPDGKGHPRGQSAQEVPQLVALFNTANNFIRETCRAGIINQTAIALALKVIEKEYMTGHYRAPAQALIKLVQTVLKELSKAA